MVDMNIEFLSLFIIISVMMPLLMLIFFKQEKRIMLDMSLIIIGIFWIFIFGFTVDNIILGYNVTATAYNSTTNVTTIDNEPITVELVNDIDGSPTEYRTMFMFFSVVWVFIGMFSAYSSRR